MRPIRLEIEGFTSFREKAVLDFEGLDLFAITGPTGAGKSSLVDALVFALYGQVPRVGKEYRQLLSHGAERANVRLDFAVGDERFRVVRTIRAAGPAPTRLERIEPGPPERTEALADRVSEIEKQVERIVGLDYDAFTRSVVLPQGQFDAFLKGEPKERRKILIALLNLHVYERMQEAVNRRAADARREAEFISGQLASDFAGATADALDAKRQELLRARDERARAEAVLSALAEVATAAQRVRTARRESETLARDSAAATEALLRAEAAPAELRKQSAALGREQEALAQRLVAATLDDDRPAVLQGARPAARQLAELVPKRERLETAAKEKKAGLETQRNDTRAAERAIPAAEKTLASARAALDEARAAREALHRSHAAHLLRRTLRPGEPCPVCTQAVLLLPPVSSPDLAQADAALRAAETSFERAQQELQASQIRLERSRGGLAGLETGAAQAGVLLAEADDTLRSLRVGLGEAGFGKRAVDDPQALVRAIESELATLDKARAERAKAEAEGKRLEAEATRVATLLAAADAHTAAGRAQVEALQGRVERAGAELRKAEDALADLTRRHDLRLEPGRSRDEADEVEALRAAAQKEVASHTAAAARLEAETAELESRIALAARHAERKKGLDADHALAQSLALHLRADQFLAYVQEEALRLLAGDGSRHLRQLSQGRYSLVCEGQEFFVVDHWNADARRSVKTLSGGETFLASLGLALALAESLATLSAEGRAGEALESLFLDEGFGTLDPETLAQVVQAIEALHGGERMVGLITHLPELAEQMPARVAVGRSDRGATLTIS